MVDAAVGSRAILGRGIGKTPGLPQGSLHYLNFNSAEFGRNAKENASDAITGFGGRDRGTPGQIDYDGKLNYDLTVDRILFDLVAQHGAPASIDDLGGGAGPWLVKVRPGALTPIYRDLWNYLHEGGSYSGTLQYGRRAGDITLKDAADKRIEVDVTYTEPTGDTIAGMPVEGASNSGTIDLSRVGSRGRRPQDADFAAEKSVYIKVTAITDPTRVTVAAMVDDAGFAGSGTFGANTFEIFAPDASGHDGFSIVKNSNTALLLGNFGENFEPFEVTLGDQDLSTAVVGDVWEFPVALLPALTKSVIGEHRISEYHLLRTIGGTTDVRFDSGSVKWSRPYKPYYTNGRRLPLIIDPTGDIGATIQLKKRLADRRFRDLQDGATRFTGEDVYKFGQPLTGTTFEGIHVFYPQLAVSANKSGGIPNKNTLEEAITLEAEQPDATPSSPAAILDAADVFDADPTFPYQVNIITPNDPSFLGI